MMLTAGDTPGRQDGGGYKFDPGHPDFYRCPVSTPANNKRPLEGYDPTGEVAPSLPERKSVTSFSRPSLARSRTIHIEKPMRKNVDYYFVDKNLQRKESNQTNTFWLQSLCAQPVTEILGKYRRKSDFQRTRYLWSKMFSTPGERALLEAWTKNASGPQRATSTPVNTTRAPHRQNLTMSNEMKVFTVKSAGSRKSDFEFNPEDLRPQLSSAASYHHYTSDYRSMSRESPVVRPVDSSSDLLDDNHAGRIVLADNENIPNLSGQRRKGQIVLQQRKYFSGNRQHPAIPHVQRLNPVKTEDIAQSADVICLKPTQKSPTPRVTSRQSHTPSRDRHGSAYSTSDVDNVLMKFPLIISTKPDTEETGEEMH